MYSYVVALLATSASAFAPQSSAGRGGAVKAGIDSLESVGIVEPFPGFFDPLNLAEGKSAQRIKYFREAELKHGRVAMLAAAGFLLGESFHPLFGGNIDVPSYVAFQATPLQTFWPIVVGALFIIEASSAITTFENPLEGGWWTMKADHKTGDLGFDPLGLKPVMPADFKEMQTKELQNGRLAMLGIAGMVAQELINGQKIL